MAVAQSKPASAETLGYQALDGMHILSHHKCRMQCCECPFQTFSSPAAPPCMVWEDLAAACGNPASGGTSTKSSRWHACYEPPRTPRGSASNARDHHFCCEVPSWISCGVTIVLLLGNTKGSHHRHEFRVDENFAPLWHCIFLYAMHRRRAGIKAVSGALHGIRIS